MDGLVENHLGEGPQKPVLQHYPLMMKEHSEGALIQKVEEVDPGVGQ